MAEIGPGDALQEQRGNYIGAFYGSFFSWANLLTFLIQSFLVSRFFQVSRGAWIPLRRADHVALYLRSHCCSADT